MSTLEAILLIAFAVVAVVSWFVVPCFFQQGDDDVRVGTSLSRGVGRNGRAYYVVEGLLGGYWVKAPFVATTAKSVPKVVDVHIDIEAAREATQQSHRKWNEFTPLSGEVSCQINHLTSTLSRCGLMVATGRDVEVHMANVNTVILMPSQRQTSQPPSSDMPLPEFAFGTTEYRRIDPTLI